MSFTIHTSGGAIATAGTNVNSDIVDWATSQTELEAWSDQAESRICSTARYDVVTNYSDLTTKGKEILSEIADAMVAQKIINYEPEAIGLTGASLRLNLLQSIISDGLSKIDNDKIKTYLKIT